MINLDNLKDKFVLLVDTLENAGEFMRLLDRAGVQVRPSCGCKLHGHAVCIWQLKTPGFENEYFAYKNDLKAGDKDSFYRCPHGHTFAFEKEEDYIKGVAIHWKQMEYDKEPPVEDRKLNVLRPHKEKDLKKKSWIQRFRKWRKSL